MTAYIEVPKVNRATVVGAPADQIAVSKITRCIVVGPAGGGSSSQRRRSQVHIRYGDNEFSQR